MHYLHLTRNLRSFAFLMIVSAVLTGLGILWWANHTGLPESWRAAIEREISKQGTHVKIGRLSYRPLRGVTATDVRIFSDPEHHHEISRLVSVILNFDKTKLARGIIHLTKIELKDAQLILPLGQDKPTSTTLEITDVNGTLLMPGDQRIEIRNASGRIAGIEIHINARLVGYQPKAGQAPDTLYMEKRRELLVRVIRELNQWQFDAGHPPQLRVAIESDANERTALKSKLTLHAKGVGKNQHWLDAVEAQAEITGDLITITSLHATDSRGTLDGHLDYDIGAREGRFDVHSSLEIPGLLDAWLGLPTLRDVVMGGSQTLEAAGEFRLDEHNNLQIHMTGQARCDSVSIRGTRFDTVQSAFSWRDNDLFLRDVRLTRPNGEIRGKAMIQWPLIRLALDTNLPIPVYRPFFIGEPLEQVLNDFSERKGAEAKVTLEGGFDADVPDSWAFVGDAKVQNVNYKGVPVNSAECRLSLSPQELDFFDGTVVFNYQNYALRDAFNGPKQGTVKVGRVRYDEPSHLVEVENVAGAIWAAPMVRLFAPKVADSLEVYRFHRPPEIKGSGVVDVTPQGRTALNISFNTEAAADYRFLGENLTLDKPNGKVTVRGKHVTVDDLKLSAFDGPVVARFDRRGGGLLEGELSWTRLTIPALASTYGFQMKGGGNITGRLNFSLRDARVETMAGEGLFAVEKTELFAVPIFGPLSPLVSGVLNDRSIGFERANSAFCTFKIKEGMLSTRDFRTSSTSLTFTGDGAVNLQERTFDMTMRMNARGLLGLITLPLRPFYGMFQFRGTGPLKNPKWENAMFTTPPPEQHELLVPTPKAKIVTPKE
jgi:hypothetical protein